MDEFWRQNLDSVNTAAVWVFAVSVIQGFKGIPKYRPMLYLRCANRNDIFFNAQCGSLGFRNQFDSDGFQFHYYLNGSRVFVTFTQTYPISVISPTKPQTFSVYFSWNIIKQVPYLNVYFHLFNVEIIFTLETEETKFLA